MRKTLVAILFSLAWLPPLASGDIAAAPPKVVFRLATVGDSRQGPGDPRLTPQDAIWLQETKVWTRMMRDIQSRQAQVLVFNGDMILGYSADRAVLDRQYAYWRGLVAHLMETGTYVLPVPGNHEVQVKTSTDQGIMQRAMISSEEAWRANMGDLILNQPLWRQLTGRTATAWDVDHAPPPGSDGVISDQRQLSYSFDSGDVHMAVINTDPVSFDASAPVSWLDQDLAAARARGAKHFMVFGHKMAFTYFPDLKPDTKETGLDVRPELRDRFWDVIEKYGANYFCGHEHVYHASQPRKDKGGRAWQVIVGTAGSPFSILPGDSSHAEDRMYAWAEVEEYDDGHVHVTIHGFDDSFAPTRKIAEWDLPDGH